MKDLSRRKLHHFGIALLAVAMLLAGCATESNGNAENSPAEAATDAGDEGTDAAEGSPDGDPIEIAFIAGMSGPTASLGLNGRDGARVWEAMVNEAGGLLGRPVELVEYDGESDVDIATEAAEIAVQRDEVDFIVTNESSAIVLALTPVAEQLETVMIHAAGAAEEYQNIVNRWAFRTADSSRVFGYSCAKIAAEQASQVDTWAGINPDYAWGHAVWGSFQEYYSELDSSGTVSEEVFVPFAAGDYTSQIASLADSDAGGIFTSMWSGDQVTYHQQGQLAGLLEDRVHLDCSSAPMDVMKALGEDGVEALAVPYYWWGHESEVNQEFVDEYLSMYGDDSPPTSPSGAAYQAMQTLGAAIEKAGTIDPMAVIEALEGLEIETVVGQKTMREHDHQMISAQMPAGRTGPSDRWSHWDFVEYFPVDIPEDIQPESDFVGWAANDES